MEYPDYGSLGTSSKKAAKVKLGIVRILLWAIVTILGAWLAFFLTMWLAITDPGPWWGPGLFVGGAVGGLIAGFAVGLAQKLILPRWLSREVAWILATATGWGLGVGIYYSSLAVRYFAFYVYPKEGLGFVPGGLLEAGTFAGVGMCIVLVQSLFLSRHALQVYRWMLLACAGWLAGGIAWFALGIMHSIVAPGGQEPGYSLAAFSVIPGIGGLVTAYAFNILTLKVNERRQE